MSKWIRHKVRFQAAAAVALGLGMALHTPSARAQAAPGSAPGTALTLEPVWPIITPAALPSAPGYGAITAVRRSQAGISWEPQSVSDTGVVWADVTTPENAKVSPANAPTDRLTLSFELPIWFAGINGTVGVRGFTAPVNLTFIDILNKTDSVIGLGGRLEADYGRWIFFIDGLYMKLTKDNLGAGPVNVNLDATLGIAEAGVLYRLGDWNLGSAGQANPRLGLAVGAAGRYMHVGLSLDTVRGLSRSMNQDWADPLFAGQLTLDLDRHWQILARGDVGGGTGADLTWSAGVYLGYQFEFCPTVSGAIKLGYEAVSEDYHNGSGRNEFTWDTIMHGPMIVLAIKF